MDLCEPFILSDPSERAFAGPEGTASGTCLIPGQMSFSRGPGYSAEPRTRVAVWPSRIPLLALISVALFVRSDVGAVGILVHLRILDLALPSSQKPTLALEWAGGERWGGPRASRGGTMGPCKEVAGSPAGPGNREGEPAQGFLPVWAGSGEGMKGDWEEGSREAWIGVRQALLGVPIQGDQCTGITGQSGPRADKADSSLALPRSVQSRLSVSLLLSHT